MQEVKAQAADIEGRFEELAGLKGHFHFAEKKGYSGVAVYSRHEPSDVIVGYGSPEFDAEGRYVELRFDTPKRKLSIISCLLSQRLLGRGAPAGQVPLPGRVLPAPGARSKKEREFILCGDINIAHKEIDLKNWRSNQKNSGFLPEERAWMTNLLTGRRRGLVDVYRQLKPDATDDRLHLVEQPRPGLREQRGLAAGLPPGHAGAWRRWRAAKHIYKDVKFSDHAPITVDYDFKL